MPLKYYPYFVLVSFIAVGLTIALAVLWIVDRNNITSETERFRGQAVAEKNYKTELQGMLDAQLRSNDELVQAVDNLQLEVNNYKKLVGDSYRVIDGRTELIPGTNGLLINKQQDQVKIEQDNVEAKIKAIVEQKDEFKVRRDQIFLESNQNPQNRANPRDGAK